MLINTVSEAPEADRRVVFALSASSESGQRVVIAVSALLAVHL